MKRKAQAQWRGGLKDGSGTLTTDSGVLSATPYSFATRFESGSGRGTNPEELIGAAHAGCFSMALSNILGEAGVEPEQIDTRATVTLDRDDAGFTISEVHLDVEVKASGLKASDFQQHASKAKANCPVSRLLNAEISMEAKLVD